MYSLLLDILWIVILFDLFALGVMIILFINARINLQRQINHQYFFINTVKAAKTSKSSAAAAEMLDITPEEFTQYCKIKGISTPEERAEKKEKAKRIKLEQEQKILQEEAKWRAEREKAKEEILRKEQEENAQIRKEKLRKFGFK